MRILIYLLQKNSQDFVGNKTFIIISKIDYLQIFVDSQIIVFIFFSVIL